jgi:hypothetical protein
VSTPRPSDPAHGSGWGWGAPAQGAQAGLPPERGPGAFGDGERYGEARLLGQGGMGRVDALHDARLDRDVARKVVQASDPVAWARLVREARITARLEHPGIVPVYDAGQTPDGQPYYTMRIIRGRTLSDAIAAAHAPGAAPSERFALVRHFLDACHAVAFAHSAGVIHRDLKPQNILVGAFGETQVADWGLARAVDEEDPAWMSVSQASAGGALPGTVVGRSVGTPGYMSPEQSDGAAHGKASDVFSLGVVLREILTGSRAGELGGAPPELGAIVLKATNPDRDARYPHAKALADDVARWMDGRRVDAYTYSSWELLRRLVTAWRAPLATAGVALVVLAAVAAEAWRANAVERDRALVAEAAMRSTARDLWRDRAVASMVADDRASALGAAGSALALGVDPVARGVVAAFSSGLHASREASWPAPGCADHLSLTRDGWVCAGGGAATEHGPEGLRWRIEGDYSALAPAGESGWFTAVERDRFVALHGPTGELRPAAVATRALGTGFSAELVVHTSREAVYVHRVDATPRPVLPCPSTTTVDIVALGSEARWWAVCSDGQLVRGDAAGAFHALRGPGPALQRATVGVVDRGRLFVGNLDGEVVVVDAERGDVTAVIRAAVHAVRRIDVDAAGALGLAVGDRGEVGVFRADTAVWLGTFPAAGVRDARWDGPGALRVATSDAVEAWRAEAGPPDAWRVPGGVSALAVDAAGELAAVAVGPRLHVVGLRDAALVYDAGPETDAERVIKGLVFDRARGLLWMGRMSDRNGLRALRVGTWDDVEPAAEVPSARRTALLGDGTVVTITFGSSMWACPDPLAGCASIPIGMIAQDLAAAQVGDRVWALLVDGRILAGPVRATSAIAEIAGARRLAVDDAGDALVVVTGDALWRLDPATGAPRWSTPLAVDTTSLAVHPGGGWIALGAVDGRVMLFDAGTGALWFEAPGHTERVGALAFVRGQPALLSAGWDGLIRRWALPAVGAR